MSSQLLLLCNSSFPHKQCSDTKSHHPSAAIQNSGRRGLSMISDHNLARGAGTSFVTMSRTCMSRIRKIETGIVITAAHVRPQPGQPVPPDPSSNSWKLWVVGMLISAALPFWNMFWPLMKLKSEIESTIQATEQVLEEAEKKVEEVAEVVEEVSEKMDKVLDLVEEVSEKVEKVAEELEEQLPEGGKLKEAVIFVEHVAKETAKDAEFAEDILEKVEKVEEEMASLFGVRPNRDQKKKP